MPTTPNDELAARFAHHPPANEETVELHEWVRNACAKFAVALNNKLPESREKSLALTALQETMMWSNAAIAIHSGAEDESE